MCVHFSRFCNVPCLDNFPYILVIMGAKFCKYEVKVGGRGASVASDTSGGLGACPPEKNLIARYPDINL